MNRKYAMIFAQLGSSLTHTQKLLATINIAQADLSEDEEAAVIDQINAMEMFDIEEVRRITVGHKKSMGLAA